MKRDSANPYFMSLWLYDRFTKADSDKFFLSANNRSPEKICSEPAIYVYITQIFMHIFSHVFSKFLYPIYTPPYILHHNGTAYRIALFHYVFRPVNHVNKSVIHRSSLFLFFYFYQYPFG